MSDWYTYREGCRSELLWFFTLGTILGVALVLTVLGRVTLYK